jgi:parallel beta-helix repeat protein
MLGMLLIKGRREGSLITPHSAPLGKAGLPMRRTIMLLATMALTLLVASGVVLGAAIGSAGAKSSVVGPGESIQKAVNAAHPGDTIVVRGVHREDVIIRKDGIKLRGEDAVIQAPPKAKADSPCSRTFGPEGICVLGDVNLKTETLTGQRVRDVSISGFTFRGFEDKEGGLFAIDLFGARNATITGNRAIGNVAGGIIAGENINTTIAKNHVIGNPDTNAEGIVVTGNSRNTKIVKNDVRSIPEDLFAIESNESRDTTIAGNDLIGNGAGVNAGGSTGTKILSNDITDTTIVGTISFESTGTKILSNHISRSGETGILIFGPKRANNDAKVVGNNISGGAWGMYVANTKGGFIAANTIHDNCAGMFFEANGFQKGPVSGSEVKGNTVEDNTRSCRAAQVDRNFSGIGIALLGARDMEVTGNHLSGNVPSGPTRISGGVVVAVNPYRKGDPKPMNNSVIGNHFGHNKPDIYWDESGSGNRFLGNLCDTSVPSSLCN